MENNIKKILVCYISVLNIELDKISEYVKNVTERITPKTFEGEIIVIPVYGETKIECIDPVYITDEELIRKHRLLMDQLHEQLDHQLKEIKNSKINKEKDE